jgi:hypothetical protein
MLRLLVPQKVIQVAKFFLAIIAKRFLDTVLKGRRLVPAISSTSCSHYEYYSRNQKLIEL